MDAFLLFFFIIRPHRSTTAYYYRRTGMVCLSVCHDREPCKNRWNDRDVVWIVDSGGPNEPCIRWGPVPIRRDNFEGEGWPIVKYRDTLLWVLQKRLNQSRCLLGCGLYPKKHVLDKFHIGASWWIRLNRPYVAAMQPFCQITLTICYTSLES